MSWIIIEKTTKIPLNEKSFDSQKEASNYITNMGFFFQTKYLPFYKSSSPFLTHIINEGLVKNDLENILLPKVSIDEYIPSDPNTDNIVLAFFIKGVPEAVIPFKNFCEKNNGVLDVDYGDSETILNTSIVYIEFDRDNIKIDHIKELMSNICILSNLNIADFTMTFPNTSKKFPFSFDLINDYFNTRNDMKNKKAQKKAEKEAEEHSDDDIKRIEDLRKKTIESEDLADRLSTLLFESE